jgi:hypothetical protein
MFAAPLLCELTVPAPVAVALQQTWAAVRAQLPPVQRAPFRPAGEMAHVVDNVTHLRLLPIVRLGIRRDSICAAPIWRSSIPAPARC